MQPAELVVALALLLVGTLAQSNVVVEETSSALIFDPPLPFWNRFGVAAGQPADDYYHGGGYVSTSSLGASVSLKFNGSYVAFYSDGYPAHGMMEVDLDGRKTNVSQYSPDVEGQKMFFESYIDPDVPNHVLKLTCLDTKTMGVDYFAYTPATPKAVGSASELLAIPSASKSDTTTSHPSSPSSPIDTTPPASSTPVETESTAPPDQSIFTTDVDSTTESVDSSPTSITNTTIISSSSSKTNIIIVVVSVFSGILTLLCAPLFFILRRLRRQRRRRAMRDRTTPYITEVTSVGYAHVADANRVSISSSPGNQRPSKLDQLGMTDPIDTGLQSQPGPSGDYDSRHSQLAEYGTSDDSQPPPYV